MDSNDFNIVRECQLYDFECKAGMEQIERDKHAYSRQMLGTYGEVIKRHLNSGETKPLPLPWKIKWQRFKQKITRFFRKEK